MGFLEGPFLQTTFVVNLLAQVSELNLLKTEGPVAITNNSSVKT